MDGLHNLMQVELDAVAERIAKGTEAPTGYDATLQCHCKFYRQYLLPCRHIFHFDSVLKLLTPSQWKVDISMFEECGMEVYETTGTIWVVILARMPKRPIV